jgi:hypothetical protein
MVVSIASALWSHRGELCKQCGARRMFAGRHFDPAGDLWPHVTDILIGLLFTLSNVLFWLACCSGRLFVG